MKDFEKSLDKSYIYSHPGLASPETRPTSAPAGASNRAAARRASASGEKIRLLRLDRASTAEVILRICSAARASISSSVTDAAGPQIP